MTVTPNIPEYSSFPFSFSLLNNHLGLERNFDAQTHPGASRDVIVLWFRLNGYEGVFPVDMSLG